MRLIDEWRKAWRFLSVQAMTAAGAIQAAWMTIPEEMKVSIPPNIVHWATLGLLFFGIVGRLVKQDDHV